MDDESGELMELMERLESLVRGWRREAGSWFQRQGEAYWKEWSVIRREDDVDGRERVWPKMKSECCEEAELWWGYADMKVGWLWELWMVDVQIVHVFSSYYTLLQLYLSICWL